MSKKEVIQKEVMEAELATLRMMRRRAGDDSLRAAVIAERELVVSEEIEKLKVAA